MEITIAEFKEQYLSVLQDEFHTQVQKSIEANGKEILRTLNRQMESFITFTNRFQSEIPFEIGEVQISLLQTSVYLNNPQLAFCAYDEQGILGKEIFNIKFDAKWLFTPWSRYQEVICAKVGELHAESYIRKAAVQQMMWDSMDFIIYCLYATIKYQFQEFFRLDGYEKLILTDNFRLSVGGYRDWSRTLYRKRPQIDIFFADSKENFQYRIFKEAVYNRKEFNKLDLMHTCFYDCEFVHSKFSDVLFKDAVFENCRFYHCEFVVTDFGGATFRNTTMKKCNFKKAQWNSMPDEADRSDLYKSVDLKQCVFEYVNFEQCDLRGIRQSECTISEITVMECENDGRVFGEVET